MGKKWSMRLMLVCTMVGCAVGDVPQPVHVVSTPAAALAETAAAIDGLTDEQVIMQEEAAYVRARSWVLFGTDRLANAQKQLAWYKRYVAGPPAHPEYQYKVDELSADVARYTAILATWTPRAAAHADALAAYGAPAPPIPSAKP